MAYNTLTLMAQSPSQHEVILGRSRFGRSVAKLSQHTLRRTATWFRSRFGQSASFIATARFLRRQMWAWPLFASVFVSVVGWWVHHAVERAMHERRREELTTILQADVAALRLWYKTQEQAVTFLADEEQLRPPVQELLAIPTEGLDGERALLVSKAQTEFRQLIQPHITPYGYEGYMLVSPTGVVLASDQDTTVGKALAVEQRAFFDTVAQHGAKVSKPFRSTLLLRDAKGELRAHLPTMLVAAPIPDVNHKPLAYLGLRVSPDVEFTRILQVARSGETGETYVFDRHGMMLSESRFDDDLKQIGLLADFEDSRSILTLQLRDPQVNMNEGERPKVRRAEQPLTHGVAEAIAGNDGCNADGYRDYRGVPVVGAWLWLPEYDFGVISEITVDESFAPLYILRRAFWTMLGLLLLSAVAIYVAMIYMARQQRALQQAVLQAKNLGQYTLEGKLGSGGMGTVYRAKHSLLRRPTAIKLLDLELISDTTIARFEREVQLTSGLSHPNTVSIYDYGRTPEGIFYYVMEYLDGQNLDDLVTRYGPLPEARVMFLLKQVCGSLAEAHGQGLVHRDIKPANIFLTCRGGLHDFVKVLDFGLVKTMGGLDDAKLTSANAVTGTPLYLPPEAINQPDQIDARADVYAVGAVGYFLLTGTPVFTGASLVEICMKHTKTPPEAPSTRLGKPVTPTLEELLLRCLAKRPLDRPADAAALLAELEACMVPGHWSHTSAASWWVTHNTNSATPKAPLDQTIHYHESPTTHEA